MGKHIKNIFSDTLILRGKIIFLVAQFPAVATQFPQGGFKV